MVIREMSREECLHVLAGVKLARLAYTYENQPYVVPVYFAYHEASGCLYGFTTPGQKVEGMRANPLVCVEVDGITADNQWVSVIATGRYKELPETPGSDGKRLWVQERLAQDGGAMPAWSAGSRHRTGADERERAWEILKTRPMWWEPACTLWAVRTHRGSPEPFHSVFYKIQIDSVTGYEATREDRDALPAPHVGKLGLLRGTLTRLFGGRSKEAGSAF